MPRQSVADVRTTTTTSASAVTADHGRLCDRHEFARLVEAEADCERTMSPPLGRAVVRPTHALANRGLGEVCRHTKGQTSLGDPPIPPKTSQLIL